MKYNQNRVSMIENNLLMLTFPCGFFLQQLILLYKSKMHFIMNFRYFEIYSIFKNSLSKVVRFCYGSFVICRLLLFTRCEFFIPTSVLTVETITILVYKQISSNSFKNEITTNKFFDYKSYAFPLLSVQTNDYY